MANEGEGADSGGAPQPAVVPQPPALLMKLGIQATVLRGWAEAALMKLRLCSCMGCAAAALLSVRTCHDLVTELYNEVDSRRRDVRWLEERESVGLALLRTLKVHVALLLITHAHASPNKTRLRVAVRCVEQWEALMHAGLRAKAPRHDHHLVRARQTVWVVEFLASTASLAWLPQTFNLQHRLVPAQQHAGLGPAP